MPRLLTKKLLSEARVATRAAPERTVAAILRSVLLSSGDGSLVTDLEHRSLAVNARFGELFAVSPDAAVLMEPEELRKQILELSLQHNLNIVSLQSENVSLEEVFKELTTKA